MPGNRLPAVLEQVSVVQLDGAVAFANAVARAIRTCRSFLLQYALVESSSGFSIPHSGGCRPICSGRPSSDCPVCEREMTCLHFAAPASANCQNSSSLPSGLPLRSQIS